MHPVGPVGHVNVHLYVPPYLIVVGVEGVRSGIGSRDVGFGRAPVAANGGLFRLLNGGFLG